MAGAMPLKGSLECSSYISQSYTTRAIEMRGRLSPSDIGVAHPEPKTASQLSSDGGPSASQSPNEDTANETSDQQLQSVGEISPDPSSAPSQVAISSTGSLASTETVILAPTTVVEAVESPDDLVVVGAINASFRIGMRTQSGYLITPTNAPRTGSLLASEGYNYNLNCGHWPTYVLLALICAIHLLRWVFKSPQIEIPLRWLWSRHPAPTA